MAVCQLPKLKTRVRFPYSAPIVFIKASPVAVQIKSALADFVFDYLYNKL